MYIVQMADLHIGSATKTVPGERELVNKSIDLIKKWIPKESEILLCLCGDVIDSKKTGDKEIDGDEVKKRYAEAAKLIGIYRHSLEDLYKFSVKCCLGNHDVTHGTEFHEFVKITDSDELSLTQLKGCYTYECGNSYFLFVNSCAGDQHTKGKIGYDGLERELRNLPRESRKILVLHHTVMSMYEDDDSSIRDAAKLIGIMERHSVAGVLHGHIHGREILRIGKNQCKLIGTGALFSRGNANINSQFNIIEYNGSSFVKVLNCRYNADGGNDPWDIRDLLDDSMDVSCENYLKGDSFQKIHRELLEKLDAETPLYHVDMQIDTDYGKFRKDLKDYLDGDGLQIGGKKYDYFKLAEMWERESVPDELYFNHGSYFKTDGRTGIDFVKEQLNQKPTSNRIVLPTYNMEKVVQSLDDSIYLPSLEHIQFGRTQKKGELFVHMCFRALEASRFFKINICEIAYILEEIRKGKNAVDFDKVKIIISAFRVQVKDHFNCFLKAEIDKIDSSHLDAKVSHGKTGELCELLREKKDGMETITKVEGIRTVYKAMKASNAEAGENAPIYYGEEMLRMFEELLEAYRKLDTIHRQSSVTSKEEKECEKKIERLLGDAIGELEKLDAKRKEKNV